jgi:hypothetical protein
LWGFFQDRVSWTICPDWLWTMIFLISASWVARITGVSHWRPAQAIFYLRVNLGNCRVGYWNTLK